MRKGWNRACRVLFVVALLVGWMGASERAVGAEDGEGDDGVYDSLKKRIREDWDKGVSEAKKDDGIEVKGDFLERAARGVANGLYARMTGIKAGALFIGILSLVAGILIAALSKLNKSLRRFAIQVLVVTVPAALTIFVFGMTRFVSIFK